MTRIADAPVEQICLAFCKAIKYPFPARLFYFVVEPNELLSKGLDSGSVLNIQQEAVGDFGGSPFYLHS